VIAAIVAFDPEVAFGRKPTRLAGRRHGWPITGTVNGTRFEGYIGERWGRFFIALEPSILAAAKVGATSLVVISVTPSNDPAVIAAAIEKSRPTTQPSKPCSLALSR
jgi:hypothetical protein